VSSAAAIQSIDAGPHRAMLIPAVIGNNAIICAISNRNVSNHCAAPNPTAGFGKVAAAVLERSDCSILFVSS
jgi:hypothetical protein